MHERLQEDLARWEAFRTERESREFARELRDLAETRPRQYHELLDELVPEEEQARWAREEGRRTTLLCLAFVVGIVLLLVANTWPASGDPNDPQTGQFMTGMLGFLFLFGWLCALGSGKDHRERIHREIFRRYAARTRREKTP